MVFTRLLVELLTIGKNIQVEGYPGWITKHIRAFMGTLGLESTDIILIDSTYPASSAMTALGTYLSASFLLRQEIFRICWAVTSGQDLFCSLFKDVLQLKGTGMSHISLIDEYLYSRHREMLPIRLLATNHRGMMAAWEYLASLPPHEVWFAKILYDKEATACLNRIFCCRTCCSVREPVTGQLTCGRIAKPELCLRGSCIEHASDKEISSFKSCDE
jgi:hypothetical protein